MVEERESHVKYDYDVRVNLAKKIEEVLCLAKPKIYIHKKKKVVKTKKPLLSR